MVDFVPLMDKVKSNLPNISVHIHGRLGYNVANVGHICPRF